MEPSGLFGNRNVTRSHGGDGGESRQSHGGAEGTKSERGVVYVLLITFGNKHFKRSCKPLLCNEVDNNINNTRKSQQITC